MDSDGILLLVVVVVVVVVVRKASEAETESGAVIKSGLFRPNELQWIMTYHGNEVQKTETAANLESQPLE